MNVLSVFDGMSCGQIALKELGIEVNKYYASEIDKYTIKQTQHNFPNTIQLGSVTEVKAKDLEKIDLFIGGSPCQGFSFAGKQLNFEDPRSKLFFEFVRLWKEIKAINPDAKFLLENVGMKKEYLAVISQHLELFPVNINSNLLSAQNRNRWYWTNIKTKKVGLFSEIVSDIPQPQDKGILLKDILQPESEIDKKYYLSDKATINQVNGDRSRAMYDFNSKIGCLLENQYKQGSDMLCVAMRGRENGQELEPQKNGKTGLLIIPEATKKGYTEINPGECVDLENIKSNTRRGRKMDDKSNSLMTGQTQFHKYTEDFKLRRLTPTECARLQTIPDWYEWIVSDTQQYKQLGNGWTVEIIKHIFSYLINQNEVQVH